MISFIKLNLLINFSCANLDSFGIENGRKIFATTGNIGNETHDVTNFIGVPMGKVEP